jgi:predicted phosphodiesterase
VSAARRAPFQVFAVDDRSVQVTWRAVPSGDLRFTVDGRDTVVAHDAATPGSVVLDHLPPNTELTIEVHSSADDAGYELRARTHARLPGAELFRFAAISDLHLGTEVFGHRGTIREDPAPEVPHPERCATAAIDEAAAWGARRMLVKGDITNHGQVDEWRRYSSLVGGAPIPLDAVPGNHDRAFRPGQPGLAPEQAAAAFGFSLAQPVLVRDEPGVRIVLADTTTDRYNRGRVHTIDDAIVTAASEAPGGVAVVVALHHQIHRELVAEGHPVGIGHFEGRRFLDALGRTGRPVLVTSGHTHRHRRWSHAGVTVTQVGSTKDYPGVWAGYVVHEGGLRQLVRRVARPDCLRWTDHTRRAALGAWRWIAPGYLETRCFDVRWTR